MSPSAGGSAALVIANPASATFDVEALDAALAAAFGDGACLRFATTGDEDDARKMEAAILDAVDGGCDLVLAAGGDGTVSAVANVLAGIDAERRPVLGILPLGTANVLAREIEIPIDVARAAALAKARASVLELDAIRVEGRYYLTQLGAGLDAKMIEGTSREDQKHSGRWAYMRALVREMTGYRSHAFELTIDGRRYRKRAWQIIVANAKTMGTPPFTWGPDIEPTDGMLNLAIYNVRSFWDWLRLVVRFLTRRHQPDRRARYFEVREGLRIDTRHPLPVQADGDLIGHTPVDVEVARGLVRVVVGPAPEAPGEQLAETPAATPARPSDPAPGGPHDGPPLPRSPAAPPTPAPPGPVATIAADAAQKVRLTLWRRLAGLDHALYRWVNRLHAWPPATTVARIVSRTMDHGELWILVALLVAALHPDHDWPSMLVLIAALWLAELTVNFPLKAAFRRQRPYDAFPGSRVQVDRLPRDWSFPSGHSATAFAGAALLTPALPILAPLFFAYAAIVALSRVYLGVHYPVDVLLGGAVGIGLAVVYGTVGQAIVGAM